MAMALEEYSRDATGAPQSDPARRLYLRLVIGGASLIVLTIVIVTGALIWHLRQNRLSDSETAIQKFDLVLAEQTTRVFDSVDLVLSGLQRDLKTSGIDSLEALRESQSALAVHDELRLKISGMPQLDSLFIVGLDGRPVVSSSSYPAASIDDSDRDYFTTMRDHPELTRFLSAPTKHRIFGTRVLFMARRLSASDGSFIGVVVAALALRYFDDFYKDIYLGEGSSVGLFREDGVFFARYPPLPWMDDSFRVPLHLDRFTDGQFGVVHVTGQINPVPLLLAIRRVPGHSLVSSVTITEQAILAPWREQAIGLAVGSAVLIWTVGMIGWLLLRQIAASERLAGARAEIDRESEARRQLQESLRQLEEAANEARRSEARLRRSEQHLTHAQELGSIGSYEHDYASKRLTWSSETYRIFGVSAESYVPSQEHFLEMVHVEDRPRVVESHRRRAALGDEDTLQYRIVRPDGAIRVIRRRGTSIRNEQGTISGYIGTLQDITEQHRGALRLALLQSVSLAIAEANDFESALAVVLRSVCAVTESAYGEAWIPEPGGAELARGPVWHRGTASLATYAEERRELRLRPGPGHIVRAWQTRQPVWAPDLLRSGSSNWPLVPSAWRTGITSAYVVPICSGDEVLAVLRFVMVGPREWDHSFTEIISAMAAQLGTALSQKRVAQALRESEQMARGIVSTTLDAFVQIEESGIVIEWNPRAEALFGWAREEAIGRSLAELIIPATGDDGDEVRLSRFLHIRESGILGRRFEMQARHRDGRLMPVEIAVTALSRRSGYVFNGFIRDLTDKMAVENQLRQAQKMEAVGSLTGGLAHDFNNLLGVIIGNLELLRELVRGEPDVEEVSSDALEAAHRGADLTRRLLAFARRQALQPQITDANELVGGISKLLRRTIGEQIEFRLSLAAELWPITIDPVQLEAAITNLATNARDAMPKGGRLIISTHNSCLDGDYASMNWEVVPGDYVLIEVSDSGCGMAPEIVGHIFDPFFTTKEEGKGSGLGLSMVFGFIKQSGGHVTVYSEPGHGSVFRLYLPRSKVPLPPARDAAPTKAVPRGNEAILVVEDNEKMRAVVTKQLAGLGYRVLEAANAAEALEVIASRRRIDLLFTDVVMPGSMDGYELAREAVRRRPGLRLLLTSGFPETRLASPVPGSRLLNKPYTKDELARLIRAALDEAAPHPQPDRAAALAAD